MPLAEKFKKLSINKRSLVWAAVWALVHTAVSIWFVIRGEAPENLDTPISVALRICGIAAVAVWIVLLVVARIVNARAFLRGLFFYGLAGILFFAVALAMKLASGQTAGGVFLAVFDWFTVMIKPVAYLLAPLIGMSEFYRKAIVFGLLTAAAGDLERSVSRQRAFEKEMAERRKMQEESERRHAQESGPNPGQTGSENGVENGGGNGSDG